MLAQGLGERGNPEEEQMMGMFLATQNSIRKALVDGLVAIEGYGDVLMEIVSECLSLLETGQYVLPDERHSFLKVGWRGRWRLFIC